MSTSVINGRDAAVAAPRSRREARRAVSPLALLATLGLTLTSVATVYSFCRIFPGWAFFPQLSLVAVAVHLISLVGRYRRWNLAIVAGVSTVVTGALIGAMFLPDTMTAGIIPSPATWDGAWQFVADSWSQFRVTVTPVPSDGGFGITLALCIAATAFLADGFAFRAYGRAEAVIPGGLLFVVTSSLGYERLRVTSAAVWLVAALAAVVVLRAAHSEGGAPWLGGGGIARRVATLGTVAVAAGGFAALAAVIVGPSLPGANAEPLVSTRQKTGSGTEVLSPLVDIQARLVNRSNVELFTVAASEPRYWRLTSLESFDGRQWRQKREYSDADELGSSAAGGLVQQIRIASLGGIWLPAAFTPAAVESSVSFRFNAELGSLIRARGDLFTGLEYSVASQLPVITPDQLAAATSVNPPSDDYAELPDDFPDELRTLAAEITAGASSDYEKSLALQNYFRANFTYNPNVPRGHSERAMETFLRGREGYCEQFAGTFAALARAVNMSSRVAVGFTPGDIDEAGIYHVRGKHAHAWPEVWFEGVGWVQFEPTPNRGDPGAEGHTAVPAAQEGGVVTGPPDEVGAGDGSSTADNGAPVTTAPGTGAEAQLPDEFDPTGGSATTAAPALPAEAAATGSSGLPVLLTLLGIVGLAGLWLLAMPPIVKAMRAGRISTSSDQVLAAWDDATIALGAAGSARRPDETPLEYADRAWRATGCDRGDVRRLAELANVAAYSPAEPTEAMATEAEALARQTVKLLGRRAGFWTKLVRRADPRLAPIV